MTKGQTTVPLLMVVGAICTWCAGLSVAAFNANGTVSGLTISINDIKENTSGFQEVKAEVDWLAKQRGYKSQLSTTTAAI